MRNDLIIIIINLIDSIEFLNRETSEEEMKKIVNYKSF